MADPEGDGNHILLTTDHSPSMHNIAWTRHYRNARVFCYQSGHDNRVYANPGFRAVLGRGIQWCAGAW
jgi:type 1 glutamine amidotransferase